MYGVGGEHEVGQSLKGVQLEGLTVQRGAVESSSGRGWAGDLGEPGQNGLCDLYCASHFSVLRSVKDVETLG